MLRSWVRSPSSPPAKYQAAKRISSAAFYFQKQYCRFRSNTEQAAAAACRKTRSRLQCHLRPLHTNHLVHQPNLAPNELKAKCNSAMLDTISSRKHRHKAAKPAQITERALHSCLVFGAYSSASVSTTTGSSAASSSIKLPNRGWPSWLSSTMPVRTSTYW